MTGNLQKLFILDTNVLLVDPGAIDNFADNFVVLSMTVLEELDGLKHRAATRYEARSAVNRVLELTTSHAPGEVIELKNGGRFVLDAGEIRSRNVKGFDLSLEKADNRLLALAIKYKSDKAYPSRVVVVTNDGAVRVKAHALGLASEEYEAVNYQKGVEDLYIKPAEIPLENGALEDWATGKPVEAPPGLHQGPVFIRHSGDVLDCGYVSGGRAFPFGAQICEIISPMNRQQDLALHLLYQQEKKVVALVGHAGTGKTILALAAAIEQKLLKNTPGKVIIFRPNDQVAEEIGFLPGRLDEKFGPHKRAIRDAYEIIHDSVAKNRKGKKLPDFDSLTNDEGGGRMPVLPINFIRGSTLHNALIIIDEAQNFSAHQMKTLLTRAGRNTRVFITGDPDQIDNRFLSKRSCGLTHVIGKMRDHELFAYINLTQGERSEIASLAANVL